MAINVSVQYNGGLLPDMMLLTQCYYHRGTRLKGHEEVSYLQPMYVCMYGHTCSKSMDQPDKVASPARGQLNRKNEDFPVRVRA